MGFRLNVRPSVFPEIDGKIISAHCSGAPATKEATAAIVRKDRRGPTQEAFHTRRPADRHDTQVACAVTLEGPRTCSVGVMVQRGRQTCRVAE